MFHAFKQFLDFSGICFRIKNKFEKKKSTLLEQAEPEGPTHFGPRRPPPLGVRPSTPGLGPAPIKASRAMP
jgi:hypothetical protein